MRWLALILIFCGGLWGLANADPPAADPVNLSEEERAEGFVPLFDGQTLEGWIGVSGSTDSYYVKDGMLICKDFGKDHIFTEQQYGDFILRFEVKITPGGNNGIGIRSKITRQPHIEGMEIQVLDDDAPKHANIRPYQHHGSVYGVVPAKTGHLKPAGEWNRQEIRCEGSRIRITLNGAVIVDADLDDYADKPGMDGQQHPGLKYAKGHIGLLAHGDGQEVFFRNLRIKELK